MKQIIQNLKTGDTRLEDVPAPMVRRGHLLIRTHRSLVSLGTERMLVEFGKANLISKARQQPEKVKQVLDKIRTEGLMPTLEAVFNKLDEPLPLGYCNAGEVIAVGEGITEFKVGDRVASNGHHAEVVCVPRNLCARIPDSVTYEEATFVVIGAIGLQGLRLAAPTYGETVVVIGLGLVGLITCELLLANGCNVIGFDVDQQKVEIAKSKGVLAINSANTDTVRLVEDTTNGVGCDAVLIAASTKSNAVITEAARMSRKKGRIVLIGVVGLDIQRSDFFKKELSFQVSCSYGPGRYDEDYELKGNDYPRAYVRWTEQRNFEAILNSIAKKQLNVDPLITERVALKDYQKIYDNMRGNSIASIIEYPETQLEEKLATRISSGRKIISKGSAGVIGVVGAGNFTKMTMLPALKDTGARFKYIASANGLSARSLASKYQFEYSTSDYKEILQDQEVDLLMITTRHDLHARMVVEGLQVAKHVFVEKPLSITKEELHTIEMTYAQLSSPVSISVGFNRRFSPYVQKAKALLGDSESPINIVGTLNAGYIAPDVWIHDMKIGGGRIVGEACHYIDTMIYLAGSRVSEVVMNAMGTNPHDNTDNATILLKFVNGSQGVINYFANGSRAYSKERIEIYSQGRTLIIDNFQKMKGYGFRGFSALSGRLDKGHKTQFFELIKMIKEGGQPLISFDDLVNTTRTSLAAIESLKLKEWISIDKS